jgi:pSer/pThr/pTyr-binding forkhead associated (FHA) protein
MPRPAPPQPPPRAPGAAPATAAGRIPPIAPPPPSGPAPVPQARPAGPKATATKARLQVVNGPQAAVGKTFPVLTQKPTVIGRDPQADVPIPSERISRKHCQLEPSPDGLFVLADLGSSNGTLVNQERVDRKVLLGGEYIQVGDVLLRFLDA